MTEYTSFNVFNLKNVCRTCLLISDGVSPMTLEETNLYQTFVSQIPVLNYEMLICIFCRWMFKKYHKFTEQCQKACDILCQELKVDSNSLLFLQDLTQNNLGSTIPEYHYVGPDDTLDERDTEFDSNDGFITGDDDMPLMMLRRNGDCHETMGKIKKKKNRKKYLRQMNTEIKQQFDIKKEYELDSRKTCKSKIKRRKAKSEVKEGFTSRMVQETDEYIVIKLTKEQVLQEMDEKSKGDVYLRAPYKCEKCVKGFNFEDVLASHLDKHSMENGTFQCDICTQYCPNAVSLRGHIKSHTTRYKCKVCGHVRLSRQHLLEHHAISHTSAAAGYRCDTCPFTTNKRTVIQRHVKSHLSTEQHSCHQCGKLFKTIDSLRVHAMRHDKSRRFQCEQCNKTFIYPSLLHKHIQAVHERKDYYCVECDVKFKSPETLRLHFKKAKKHRDSTSYKHQCPHCPDNFFTSSSLSVHLSAAHGEPKQHCCVNCHRSYGSREALRAHAWRVHSQRPRAALAPTCSVCRNTFSRKSILKIHMRTHTGERPYACACGAAFTQRATLRAHCNAKHKKQDELVPNAVEVAQNTPNEP